MTVKHNCVAEQADPPVVSSLTTMGLYIAGLMLLREICTKIVLGIRGKMERGLPTMS